MNQVTYIPVIDANEQPLAPCHPARARKLIKKGRAKPFIRWDLFCLQLVDKTIPPEEVHQSTLAVNPGAEHTGIAAFRQNPESGKRTGLLAIAIHHRGKQVKHQMEQRKNYRWARRRRLRYRAPRFDNRTKPEGWLAPSVKSRLDNTLTWVSRLQKLIACEQTLVETLVFDIQKLLNPAIRGKEYQQGPLYQTTLRAYIYHRDSRKCRYCGKRPTKENPLTLDHVVPVANFGPDRPDNIVAACRACNQTKGSMPVEQFLGPRRKARLASVQTQLKKPMASETQFNIIQSQLLKTLEAQGHTIVKTSTAETAANRQIAGVVKTHGNDAAVLGELTQLTNLPPAIEFQAKGHGKRQRCIPDKHGTPRGKAWPKYCRARDKSRPLPTLLPSHKQRQLRFPDATGISTGDYVQITNRNGTFSGYAMLYRQGLRIALSGHQPKITGYIRTTQLLHRSHGYYRLNAKP